jgi:hypothetical protein
MSQPNPQPIGIAEITGARKSDFRKLTLGSIGVVYGDIGTSPLYAFKESLSTASAGGQPTADAIIGVISLIPPRILSNGEISQLLTNNPELAGSTVPVSVSAETNSSQRGCFGRAVSGQKNPVSRSCGATPPPAAAVWSIARRLRNGTPSDQPDDQSRQSLC